MAITYSQHADLTLEDIHALVRWEVVNTAARLALVLVAADKHKVCYQADNNTYWVLADHAAPTWVEWTTAGAAAVTSVFGEIGDVSEADANFTAADIANVPAGTVAATDVQSAIDELETEKAPATHTHVLSQVTDAGTAAAEDVGVTLGDIPQLEDVGGGTPGLPAVDGSQLTGVAGGGSAITVTDEGGAPLTTDVVSFDFVGTGVTASSVGDDVTVTIAAGAAPIDTVFGRTGTVAALPGDYDASQVDNDSTVTGSFVDDALNTLDTFKAATGDARFPTTDEKGALAGTGTPSGSNRYVVDDDSRLVAGAVSAGATVTDNTLVRGDGGARGVQDSGISIDDTDNVTGVTSLEVGGVTLDSAGLNETSAGYFFGGANGGASPADNVFTGGTSNSASVKGGANYTRGGIAQGTTSEGGDLNLYGGTGTSGPGAVRVGGYDTTPNASEIEMMKGFSIREASDHPNATVAGRGQLWPRSSDGAIMWTDRDDVDHDLTTSGSGTMAIEDEGTPVSGGPHSTMDFIGAGVTAADAGGGTVSITIAPGAAPIDTVFSRTGTVVALASDYDASQIDNDANDVNGNVTGAYVSSALDTADAAIESAQSDATDAIADAAAAQSDATSAKTKTDFLTVTQTINLDTVESDTATNNAKRSYPVADEALVDGHETTLANVSVPITTAGAALLDDADTTDQRATLGLGSAAVEGAGVTIGDLVPLENVGGNPGLPAVDGSQLTGIDTGTPITVIDESTELTTNVNQFTFAGAGVVATEPGTEGEILVTISGAGGSGVDVYDGTTTVSAADLIEFDGTAFDVTDQGGADALVEPVFGSTTGTIAEGDHTHDTLANVAENVFIGRDTAGSGNSEELTPAEARALIDVTLGNIGAGLHNDLEAASVDSGKIFASLQTGQLDSITHSLAPAQLDWFLMEQSTGAYRSVLLRDVFGDVVVGRDSTTVGTRTVSGGGILAAAHIDTGGTISAVDEGAVATGFVQQNLGTASIIAGAASNPGAHAGGAAANFGAASTSTIQALGTGSLVHGYANNTLASGTSLIQSTAPGSFVGGDCDNSGTIEALGSAWGATVRGFAGLGAGAGGGILRATTGAAGAIVHGRSSDTGSSIVASEDGVQVFGAVDDSGSLAASGIGAMARGRATGASSAIVSSQDGSQAGGFAAAGSTITASADGAIAHGAALGAGGDILASGIGSAALGYALTNNVTASGNASLALGHSFSGPVVASGVGCMQVGVGTNTEDTSIAVGVSGSGVRILGEGAAASPQDGDIHNDAGDVIVETGGAAVNLSNLARSGVGSWVCDASFDTSLPSSGEINFSSATKASVTTIRLHDTATDGFPDNVLISDSALATGDYLLFQEVGGGGETALYTVNSDTITQSLSITVLTVSHVASQGSATFDAADEWSLTTIKREAAALPGVSHKLATASQSTTATGYNNIGFTSYGSTPSTDIKFTATFEVECTAAAQIDFKLANSTGAAYYDSYVRTTDVAANTAQVISISDIFFSGSMVGAFFTLRVQCDQETANSATIKNLAFILEPVSVTSL